MIKKIFGYIITICVLFLLAVYLKNYELIFVTVFIMLVPIIDILLIKYTAKNIDINIDIKNIMMKKDEIIPIDTKVINNGILPVIMIKFHFKCENMLHKTKRDIYLSLPILRWGLQECIFAIKSSYCGDMKIELVNVKCVDYFGFFSCDINKKFKKKIYVRPDGNNFEAIKFDTYMCGDIEGTEFSKIKAGDDPSEVFDIREYKPGDKFHSIHWKLSSRKKDIMVKDFSLPINSNYSIIMDLTKFKENMEREIDYIIEVTMELILRLQEEGISHQLIAYDRTGKNIYKDIIDAQASIHDIMYEIYQSCVQKNKNLLEDYDMRSDANDETNVYYIGGYIDKKNIIALDKLFSRAKKRYLYIHDNKMVQEDVDEIANNVDVKIVPININDLESGLANIDV